MRLLVTRPAEDAVALARRVEALGHEALTEPLLRIEPLLTEPLDLSGVGALVVTSRQALRVLAAEPAALDAARPLPLFAVGKATADLARHNGFRTVIEGTGPAAGLVPVIAAHGRHLAGRLLHLAGARLAFDLTTALAARGITLETRIVYRATPAQALTVQTLTALGEHRLDGVLLLSPESARTWVRLIARHGLEAAGARITHFCLSPAIAGMLAPLQGARRRIALSPSVEDLLALLDGPAAK